MSGNSWYLVNYYLIRYFVSQANLGLSILGFTFYESKI